MKKKMKRFENGGSIDEDVRARAMKSVEGLEGIKGSDIEDETGTVKGSIKRNEYGDLYDSEMKAAPKAAPKPAPKPSAPKTEPKAAMKADMNDMPEKLRGPNYKAPSIVKMVSKEVTKPTPRSPGRMIKEESEYAMKPSLQSKGESLMKMFGMKAGGKVKSASSRADGCAIRGKTRA